GAGAGESPSGRRGGARPRACSVPQAVQEAARPLREELLVLLRKRAGPVAGPGGADEHDVPPLLALVEAGVPLSLSHSLRAVRADRVLRPLSADRHAEKLHRGRQGPDRLLQEVLVLEHQQRPALVEWAPKPRLHVVVPRAVAVHAPAQEQSEEGPEVPLIEPPAE